MTACPLNMYQARDLSARASRDSFMAEPRLSWLGMQLSPSHRPTRSDGAGVQNGHLRSCSCSGMTLNSRPDSPRNLLDRVGASSAKRLCGPDGLQGKDASAERFRLMFRTGLVTCQRTNRGCRALNERNIILVVDDDPGMLVGLQRLLWLHAYKPILYSSGEDFKRHTDFEGVGCVILDINLGDGSGLELMRGLLAAGYCVPVICISGNTDPAVRKAALDTGCIAFLTKPFAAQALIEPLNRVSAARS